MKEFTEDEIEGIMRALAEKEAPAKIPLRPTLSLTTVTKVAFDELSPTPTLEPALQDSDLSSLPITLEVVYGTKTLPLSELSSLTKGTLLSLNEDETALLEVRTQGKTIATAELLACDGRFAIRIHETFTKP